jgi:uncharacterized membrane protein
MSTMLFALTLLTSIGAGLVGGVFFAFSSFVMKALSGLPAPWGVAAMQRINVVVISPTFMGAFLGTAVLSLVGAVESITRWQGAPSALLLAAALLYLIGSLGVTIACNVPRNTRLARLDCTSAEAAAYWPVYLREWLRWNHVRMLASIAAAACSAASLALRQ